MESVHKLLSYFTNGKVKILLDHNIKRLYKINPQFSMVNEFLLQSSVNSFLKSFQSIEFQIHLVPFIIFTFNVW